jgi:hypothetical protein
VRTDGTFQLIPLFMHHGRRFNVVWPYVDDSRIARDVEALFDDVRAESRDFRIENPERERKSQDKDVHFTKR